MFHARLGQRSVLIDHFRFAGLRDLNRLMAFFGKLQFRAQDILATGLTVHIHRLVTAIHLSRPQRERESAKSENRKKKEMLISLDDS